jgi:uncharacterized OsmC-like protein
MGVMSCLGITLQECATSQGEAIRQVPMQMQMQMQHRHSTLPKYVRREERSFASSQQHLRYQTLSEIAGV